MGKGKLGLDSPVLDQKTIEDIPPVASPLHNVEIQVDNTIQNKQGTPEQKSLVVEVIDVDNKKDEDIRGPSETTVHTEEVNVEQVTTPSGEATSASNKVETYRKTSTDSALTRTHLAQQMHFLSSEFRLELHIWCFQLARVLL